MLQKVLYQIRPWTAIALFGLFLIFGTSSCKWFQKEQLTFENAPKKDSLSGWVNWNLVFPANTNASQRNARIAAIEDEIRIDLQAVLDDRHILGHVQFKVDSCICDSLLYLLNADIKLWGTTGSNTTPPPPKDPGASGGPGELVDDNDRVTLPDNLEIILDTSKKVTTQGRKEPRVRLAILDTGIDPTLFPTGTIASLFWRDPATSFNNFLVGANPHDYRDDNRGRHGTAVAALALRQFEHEKLPALMILKVLDNHGVGSVFTLSCALSYTAQNGAQVINTSLGYYGKKDKVLGHYVKKNTDINQYLVTAAGNTAAPHNSANLCPASLNGDGLLSDARQFFPACYSENGEPKQVVTVTGISSLTTACFYQNYSNKFVSIGVLNRPTNCCFYNLPFLMGIEGSSFATPIVAGKIGNFLISSSPGATVDIYTGIHAQTGANNLTFQGRVVKE
jgi:subtilisin family serine protease